MDFSTIKFEAACPFNSRCMFQIACCDGFKQGKTMPFTRREAITMHATSLSESTASNPQPTHADF